MKKRIIWCLLALCLVCSLMVIPSIAAENTMNVPATGEDLRELALQYAQQCANVEWTTDTVIDFSRATSWTSETYYIPNVVYRGLPYTSDRISNNANLDEFSAALDADGKFIGVGTWNETPGADCGGLARLAYGYAGVLKNFELENMVFDPDEEGFASGLRGFDCVDYSSFSRSASTKDSIISANGEQTIYQAYARIKTGDPFLIIYPGGGEHIIMAAADAVVSQNGDGTINGQASFVECIELNAAVHDRGGYKTNWANNDYSFSDLFNQGFIPYTMEAYSQASIEAPSFEQYQIAIGGEVGFHNLMAGQVRCNYNIFMLTATVTDASGSVVAEGHAYPNSLIGDLCELSYGAQLMELPAGNYHYTLTAKIGYGEQVIVDTDISYAGCPEAPVVYISDNGTGCGASADDAIGNAEGYENVTMVSYKNSAFYRGLTMLSATGGKVVICDDVTLISGRGLSRYSMNLSPFSVPNISSEQIVTLTSNDGKTDFRKKGAELIMRRSGDQATDLELSIGTIWEDLDFVIDYDYSIMPPLTEATLGAFVSCGREKTVIGDTVTSTLKHAGEKIDSVENKKYFPKLFGGYFMLCSAGDTDLTVNGGQWTFVVGGSRSVPLYGGTKLTFGGKAIAYDGIYGGSFTENGTLSGHVRVNINGGTASGKLIIGGAGEFDVMGYDIALKVSEHPDLSGIRIINVGGDEYANSKTIDLGEFTNGGDHFTAYYNPNDFTSIVEAPERTYNGEVNVVLIVVIAAAVVVAAAAVVVLLVLKKKKKATVSEGKEENC